MHIISGAIDSLQPVKIRFYVDVAEINDAETDAITFANAHGLTVGALEFFKHPSTTFNPNTQVANGNHFNFTKVTLNALAGVQHGIDYYELTGITSFSGGGAGFAVTASGVALPVELTNFEAKVIANDAIQLNWSTATEINNQGFEIERSTDGRSFEKIDFIVGNGNSNLINNYNFKDSELSQGVYYYRLKQIDFDGAFKYSKIVNATIVGNNKFELSNFVPNPSSNFTALEIVAYQNVEAQIEIMDYLGRKVSTKAQRLENGKNTISFDLNEFTNGVYTARIILANEEFIRKLVISK